MKSKETSPVTEPKSAEAMIQTQPWFYLCSSGLFYALNMRSGTPIVMAILWHLSLGFSCFYTLYLGDFTLKLHFQWPHQREWVSHQCLPSHALSQSIGLIACACVRLDTYTWVSSQCLKLNISLSIPFLFLFLDMIIFSDSQTQNFRSLWLFARSCLFLSVP